MADKPVIPKTANFAEQDDLETPSISDILGVTPILPGEPAVAYDAGLAAMVEELEAKTVLQVYIVEKSTTLCGGLGATKIRSASPSLMRWQDSLRWAISPTKPRRRLIFGRRSWPMS